MMSEELLLKFSKSFYASCASSDDISSEFPARLCSSVTLPPVSHRLPRKMFANLGLGNMLASAGNLVKSLATSLSPAESKVSSRELGGHLRRHQRETRAPVWPRAAPLKRRRGEGGVSPRQFFTLRPSHISVGAPLGAAALVARQWTPSTGRLPGARRFYFLRGAVSHHQFGFFLSREGRPLPSPSLPLFSFRFWRPRTTSHGARTAPSWAKSPK